MHSGLQIAGLGPIFRRMPGPAREAKEQPIEALGFLACALFLGFLLGWMSGAYATVRYAPECLERGQ